MTLSAKWTVVSFFALTSVAAGSFAFAGCTVTSGNPTDSEGGTVITNPVDSGGGTDSGDSGVAATTCEGNKQTSGDFVNAACQSKLNTECCTELKTCFDLVPTADDAGTTGQDCNAYSKCIDLCTRKTDGTPETDHDEGQPLRRRLRRSHVEERDRRLHGDRRLREGEGQRRLQVKS